MQWSPPLHNRVFRFFCGISALTLLLLLISSPCCGKSIIDSDERVIEFNQPFQRIISFYPAHTRNLLEFGLDKEIIAVGRSDDQLPDRRRLSFRDDPERLLALKPDLILIRPMISRAYPRLIETMEQNDVQVVSLQPTSIDQLYSYWENLGKLTGREEAAQAMTVDFRRRLHQLQEKSRAIAPGDRKHVYFESIHRRMKTFAPGSIALFALESAGGINVAGDALQLRNTNIAEYGKERILAKAQEIDVFLAQKGKMNPITAKEIREEPGFKVIKAVQEDQIFLIEEKLVSRPTIDLLDAIGQIHQVLYGEQASIR
jgi:iron complex transport system substrate-binding protein